MGVAEVTIAGLLAPWLGLAPPSPAAPSVTCPDDMVLVEGTHHEQIQRLCLDYRMGKCWDFFPQLNMYEARHTPISVCMDRFEWPNRRGEEPHVMMRFVEAEASCASVGKRLCSEFEWEKACEGPQNTPWPYGWKKQIDTCNVDKPFRPYSESKLSSQQKAVRDAETRRLWQGEPSGARAGCESAYGVIDIVGNVEEWVTTSRPEWPYRSSLKGGYWAKPWTHCRGTNEGHGPQFRYYEIGFRCCRDPTQPETS